jgi:hypothetical protein
LSTFLTGCGGDNAAFSRYLQADARPADPSARVQFGRGKLPGDFPTGLPVPAHATLLGWERTTSDSGTSWEAVYEAPGDTSQTASASLAALKANGWQVTDTNNRNGFQSLNVTGNGANAGRTAVVAIGPATTGGRVQVLIEVAEGR